MRPQQPQWHSRYSHDVLVHDDDAALLQATRMFVQRGLSAGADVLVHGTRDRVAMMRDEFGSLPRLTYGYDEEMYLSPMRTLFSYQEQLAGRPQPTEVWVTGTVPRGATRAAQAAWSRYESVVNEALSTFPFRAMCTYDSRDLPAEVVEAARASHPTVGSGLTSAPCADYLPPFAFLAEPTAQVPQPPRMPADLCVDVTDIVELLALDSVLTRTVRTLSALPSDAIHDLVMAVHEVTANGLAHGAPPVSVVVWATVFETIVQVTDSGRGGLDPLTGYRFPAPTEPSGLWMARRRVSDLFIDTGPGRGCRVLLIQSL